MGRHNFGWKPFWDSNPYWPCLRLDSRRQALKWGQRAWGGCRPWPVTASYTLVFALQLRGGGGNGKLFSQGGGKIPVGHDSVCRHDQLLQVASASLTIPVSLGTRWESWVTLWKKRFLAYIRARLMCVCVCVWWGASACVCTYVCTYVCV